MATCEQVRRHALALPDTVEKDHFGRPSFRVRDKIFTTLWEDEQKAVLKLSIADQTALAASDPDTFFIGGWAHQGWTHVRLANIDTHRLAELLFSAWKVVAPKRLVRIYTET